MNYKRYELSQSLNGNQIVHIARTPLGAVVFREPTQEKLIRAIDKYLGEVAEESKKLEEAKTQEKIETKKVAISKTIHNKKFLENKLAEEIATIPQTQKKSFWDRLK